MDEELNEVSDVDMVEADKIVFQRDEAPRLIKSFN